jgi:O-antigen ligase
LRAPRLALPSADVAAPSAALVALGAGIIVLAAALSTREGALISLGFCVGLLAFVTVLTGFMAAPHRTVAFVIPYFALLPMLKTLVSPKLGPTKDIMIGAAALAAGLSVIQRRAVGRTWRGDQPLLVITLLFMALYFVDVGAGLSGGSRYGLAWFHGVRLVWEPLLLLLFGLSVRDPRRTLRWAAVALIVAALIAATVGLLQQVVGAPRLISLGYSYQAQVRTIGGHLRSFGTFDQPFDYATVLAFGLAGVLLWARRGAATTVAGVVIVAGLGVSYVRGAALSVVALVALLLARKGSLATAVALLAATAAAAVVVVVASTRPTPGPIVQTGPSIYLTLNGRTRSWRAALGKPSTWAFGRGVGLYGTAALRATQKFQPAGSATQAPTMAADSGYLATLSDVGIVGLIVLLAMFGRILVLLRRAIARNEQLAWFGLGVVLVLILDAALRSSLTGFPTADIAFLFAGLTLAATHKPERPEAPAPGRA